MDTINQQLKRLDDLLELKKSVKTYFYQNCPLLPLAFALAAGIILQQLLNLPFYFWLTIFAVSLITALVLAFKIPSRKHLNLIAAAACICFLSLGSIRLAAHYATAPNHINNIIKNSQSLADIQGTIISDPKLEDRSTWQFAKFLPYPPSTTCYLKLNNILTDTGWKKTTGTIFLNINEPAEDLKNGDQIQAYCTIYEITPAQNPAQFDFKKYAALKNIKFSANIKTKNSIKKISSPKTASLINNLKSAANAFLLYKQSPDDQNSALIQALLLGQRQNLSTETKNAFIKTGLAHFISLSGLHMGIIFALIWQIAKIAGLSKPNRAAVCIAIILLFTAVVPHRPPTIRAAVIVCFFCIAVILKRNTNPLNTLAFSAICLLLFSPTDIFSPGFQLSFVSVLAILALYKPLEAFLLKYTKTLKIPASPAKLLAVGLAAWIGSAPILLYHFYTINPLAPLWTIIAFPFVAFILIAGFLKILITALLPSLAPIFAFPINLAASALIKIVNAIAIIDLSQIILGKTSILCIITYYAILIATIYIFIKLPRFKKQTIISAIFITLAFISVKSWQNKHNTSLTLTCLSIGHGQTVILQTPQNKNYIFDTGSMTISDPANKIINPFLRSKAINKIDTIFLSHSDIDHINALPEITQNNNVKNIIAHKTFHDKTSDILNFLTQLLAQQNLNINSPENFKNTNPASITFLSPDETLTKNTKLNANDLSLVILIEFASKKILICSDIEQFAQQNLMKNHPDLHPDIIIAPHHGSTNTLDPNFIPTLNPETIIISCAQKNQKKYPPQQNAEIFYTPLAGAIEINISPTGKIKTSTFLK